MYKVDRSAEWGWGLKSRLIKYIVTRLHNLNWDQLLFQMAHFSHIGLVPIWVGLNTCAHWSKYNKSLRNHEASDWARWCKWYWIKYVSRNGQYKGVYRRTIEILQRASIFKARCCLKVHNAHVHLQLALSILGYDSLFYLLKKLLIRYYHRIPCERHLFNGLSKNVSPNIVPASTAAAAETRGFNWMRKR